MIYQITSGGLQQATPERWRGETVKLPRREGSYFFIDVAQLRFPGGSYLEGLNIWAGGEWKNDEPFWNSRKRRLLSGKPDRINQAQLWERSDDQQLIITDQYGGVRVLHKDIVWDLYKPTPEVVVTYLADYGDMVYGVQAVDFVIHNLQRLGEGFGVDVSGHMNRLYNRRREFA